MCYSPDSDCTSLEYPTWHLKLLTLRVEEPAPLPQGKSDKRKEYCLSFDGGELTDTSGLTVFRKILSC